MSLLLPEYEKMFRKEKNARLLVGAVLLVNAIALTTLVFMLPSYFVLTFTKDDVLKRLKAEEEVFGKKEFQTLKIKISELNNSVSVFEANENKRYQLAPLLVKIAATTPNGIQLSTMDLKTGEKDIFVLSLRGDAIDRNILLSYIDRLRQIGEFLEVDSPITNLLKETNTPFQLNIKIKPEFYKYESGK